jgi:hypothetical protein
MENKTTSPKKIGWLANLSWMLIALAFLAFFLADLRLDYEQIQDACTGEECNYLAVSQAEMDVLEAWGLSGQIFSLIINGSTLLVVSIFLMLSGIIFWRQGATRAGWFFSLALVVIPLSMIADADNVAASIPAAEVPVVLLTLIGSAIFVIFMYTFPNGRFYPRWALVPLTITILTFMVFLLESTGTITLSISVMHVALTLTMLLLLGVGIQILRYRRVSTKLERQQTKWGLLGIFILVLGFPGWFFLFGGETEFPAGEVRLLATMLGWPVITTMIMALPLTIAMAILRYRLWDIDVIIRRTLQYSLVTGVLALVYLGGVTLLQGVFSAVSGQQSPAAVVLSTLAIAALFNPLRRRVQDFIDRRFYRRKYDAERALEEFAAAARQETDLEHLLNHLANTVQETVQPVETRVWLRKTHLQRSDE